MARLDHIVREYSLRAGKSFLPNGEIYRLLHFQYAFRDLVGKISRSENLLQQYGLSPKVYLGEILLSNVARIAAYLYKNAIHPQFFADALHLIASHSTMLDPLVKRVQLSNLRRDQIAIALKGGTITRADLGEDFKAFGAKSVKERLEILEKLGVLVLKPGTPLPTTPTSVPSASVPPAPQNTTPIVPPLLALMLQDPSARRGKQ